MRGLARIVVPAIVLLSLSLGASVALADSSTISGAPAVVPGQQYYGNLASVPIDESGQANAYWLLPVAAGDTVTINWQAQNHATYMKVYPTGTNDYTVDQASTLEDEALNSNDADSVTFKVNADGTLPVRFQAFGDPKYSDDAAGPYNFNVSIAHDIVVHLAALPAAMTGTATINLATPDGAPLGSNIVGTLQISANGVPWTTIGQAAAAGGVATVPYSVPAALAGKRVNFHAVGSGAGYSTETSASQTVTLPSPPPPVTCVVPRLHGKNLRAVGRALAAGHCSLGKIHYRHTRRRWRKLVVVQSPRAGTQLSQGARVSVTFGRR